MKKQVTSKSFLKWSLSFTKKVVTVVTAMWLLQTIYSAILIYYAIQFTGDFSYLDTFITDSGETFRLVVGVGLIAKTIENVFKYNEGGVFGKSLPYEDKNNVAG